ncbi:EpsG family protein [Sphingomonas rhizophila]|uniref:EpsG family protein n=1 Tax=Sphingomonas rhizophila TaxID=2071607 RepID=A0A7G9SCY9_9SPHN|nr:EpsG family protein [Sphingomonas rhizophila]QNN65714.1 EpsG family protein [Sphingomonas rhizophila]
MIPYWTLFALFAVGAIRQAPMELQFRRPGLGLKLALLAVALLIGLRYRVGGDWRSYVDFLTKVEFRPLGDVVALSDPGYSVINWLVASAGLEIWAVNLLCGLIFVWGMWRLVRLQPEPWLCVLVAVPYIIIVVAMGYTRQAVALGLLMAALASFQQKRIGQFALLVVIAVTFHRSAIVVLPIGLLSITRNRILIGVMLLALAASLYSVFVASEVDRLVRNYVTNPYASQGAAIRVGMSLPPALLFLVFRDRFGFDRDARKLWTNLAITSILTAFVLALTSASTAVDRLALYLLPLQMVMLCRLPLAFAKGDRDAQLIRAGVVIYLASVQFVWLNYAAYAHYWVPYQFYPLF